MEQPQVSERDVELPEDSDGGLDFVRALGKQFRVLRERAGLSQDAAAEQLGYSADLLSSVERARRVPQSELLRNADRLYDAGGVLAAVADDLEEAKRKFRTKHPAWFRTFVRLGRRPRS
jgi:transcriptional regulator with XRE-family HTH domain